MTTIKVPARLNDKPEDFTLLFNFIGTVLDTNDDEIEFDFSQNVFIRHNAICLIGALARTLEKKGIHVIFLWNTMNEWLLNTLKLNGFCSAFNLPSRHRIGTSVPYREFDSRSDMREITNYLRQSWITSDRLSLSTNLKSVITSRVLEIIDNAFIHSDSSIGVVSCGQYYPKIRELAFCICDFGIGIPHSVRTFRSDYGLSTVESIEWALQKGNTTKPYLETGTPRGIGLDILKQFVIITNGRMDLYTLDGHLHVSGSRNRLMCRNSRFPGTVYNIIFKCDDRNYAFNWEN